MFPILASTKFVVDHADFVKINQERIEEFAKSFQHQKTEHWLLQAPFDFARLSDEEKLRFLFLFASLVFCFWGKPKWTLSLGGKELGGSMSLVLALVRAIDQGIPLLDFGYLSQIPEKTFSEILKSEAVIPLFSERLVIVHEIGSVMIKKFDGNATNFVKQADGDATKLLELIILSFPSFEDKSVYKGQEVYFYKRTQVLVADIFSLLNHTELGSLQNMDKLTACSDYKLPQILRRLGILEYEAILAEKIDHQIELLHDSIDEIEIRAATVQAVHRLTEEVKKNDPNILDVQVNNDLWLATQTKSPDDKPYHLTRTTTY